MTTGIERCVQLVRAADLNPRDEQIILGEIQGFQSGLEQEDGVLIRAALQTATDALSRHNFHHCCELLTLEFIGVSSNPHEVNSALVNVAMWRMQSDLDGAATAASSALDGFAELDHSRGIARAAMVLGDVLDKKSDFVTARKYYARALAVADADQRLPILWRKIETRIREYLYNGVPALATILPEAEEASATVPPVAFARRAISAARILADSGFEFVSDDLREDIRQFCVAAQLDFDSLNRESGGGEP